MEDWMSEQKYKLYQKKIGELCLQMGLVEKRTSECIEYRTELDTHFVYGEVIRMFDYDNHYYDAVVFSINWAVQILCIVPMITYTFLKITTMNFRLK